MTVALDEYHGGSKVRSISSNLQLTRMSARYQRITVSSGSPEVRVPVAKAAEEKQKLPVGYWIRISNGGTTSFDVKLSNGSDISTGITVAQDKSAIVWLLDNGTQAGTWEFEIQDQSSAANPTVTTHPYLLGSNDDPDSVWHYENLPDDHIQDTNQPTPVNVTGSEEAVARRRTDTIYVHEFAFGGGSEAFRSYDPDSHTSGLATTGSRTRPFAALVHDDENGDLLLGMGQWGAGSEGDELWQSDIADSHNWTQLSDLSESRVVLDGWYESDAAAANCYVFPNEGLGAEDPFMLDFSTGVDTNIEPPVRAAQARFAGMHLPETDKFIEMMGRIQATPTINSASVRRYDPATDFWTVLNDFPDAPLHWMFAAGVDSLGYVIGGVNESDEEVDSTYRWEDVEGGDFIARADHEGGAGSAAFSKFAQGVSS